MFPRAVIPSPSSAQAPFTAQLMHAPMGFGVGHLQSVEVVGVFHSLLHCLSFSLESGWGEWTVPLGKKEKSALVQSLVQFQWRSYQHGGY